MTLATTLRRYFAAATFAAAFGAAAMPVMAEEMPTAVVNTQEILNKATAAISLKEQVDAKVKEYQAEFKTKSAALNKEEEELGKQRSVLSQDAFENKVKAFRKKATDAQRDAQEKKAKLDKALGKGFGEIQKVFMDITSSIAKEKGYKTILATSALVYADPSLDITQDVLTKLNAKLPKVTLKFE